MACVTPPGMPAQLFNELTENAPAITQVLNPFVLVRGLKGVKLALHYAAEPWCAGAPSARSGTSCAVSVQSVLLCASAGRLRRHAARVERDANEALWERAVSCGCHSSAESTTAVHSAHSESPPA